MDQPKEIALAGASRHGGRLIEGRRLLPGVPEPFIDLSIRINPSPDGSDPTLEGAGAKVYGVPAASMVVSLPSTQAWLRSGAQRHKMS
jgi:hypothetical protein